MKYGVSVTIVQTGYIEVEADCEEEAKAKAAEMCGMCESTFYHRLREYRATLNSEK